MLFAFALPLEPFSALTWPLRSTVLISKARDFRALRGIELEADVLDCAAGAPVDMRPRVAPLLDGAAAPLLMRIVDI